MKTNQNWFKCYRETFEDEIGKEPIYMHVWNHLLCKVEFSQYNKYKIKPGQTYISKTLFSEEIGLSRPSLNRALNYLSIRKWISIKLCTKGKYIITILKWQKYQTNETKSKYQEYLTYPEWKEKANHIKERDNHKCVKCGSEKELQVHHVKYFYNRKPWEYEDNLLITLCNKCHKNEHKIL